MKLSSSSASVGPDQSKVSFAVIVKPGCAWGNGLAPAVTVNWLRVEYKGDVATVTVFSNHPNASPRSASVANSGATFTVHQAASSGIGLSGTEDYAAATGRTGAVGVTALPTRSWTAVSTASWLTLTSGAAGTGNGVIYYSVAANPGAARTARIIVGTAVLTVVQAAAATAPPSGMRFVPVTPCRIVDTRWRNMPLAGGEVLWVGAGLDCGIPLGATAHSLNITAIPQGPLGYLTVYPGHETRPFVSTLNSFDGRVKAGAAIVPVSTAGAYVYVTDPAHVVADINGYFVPALGADTSTTHAFQTVKPCRVVDTRSGNGGSLAGGQSRSFAIRSVAGCDAIPTNTAAYSLNITAIPKAGALGYLTAWAAGGQQPFVSTLNSFTGTVVANAAIVPAGTNGDISVFVTDSADVVIDINGYFGPGGTNPLPYYPTTPCRISDSRQANGSFGGPILAGGAGRPWPIPASACNLPATAAAYVLNATVVPSTTLGYLTLWPSGAAQPLVSTLNSFDGSITANAAIVPAGVGGAVSSYPSNNTHLILDTTGYFGQ